MSFSRPLEELRAVSSLEKRLRPGLPTSTSQLGVLQIGLLGPSGRRYTLVQIWEKMVHFYLLTCGAAFSGLIKSVRLFSDGLRLLFNMARRWRLQWRGCSPSHALRDSTGYELDVDAALLRLRTDGIRVSMASSSRYYRYFNAVLA